MDAQLHADCIHTIWVAIECFLAAAFIAFCWMCAPYWYNRK